MKTCTKCGELKSINEFRKDDSVISGLFSWCRPCEYNDMKERERKPKGLISKIYSAQRQSSRHRGHQMPSYTNKELREWVLSQKNFDKLYSEWVESGYKKELRPSVDRIDDYKGYSFDNIQLVTWDKNHKKSFTDRIEGRNNKKSRAIYQIDFDGNIIKEFYSVAQAEREGFQCHQNIIKACQGDLRQSGGFIWMYKDEYSENEKEKRVLLIKQK